MAVSAVFLADFRSFTNEVNKAELKLRTFESSTGSVSKALAQLGDSFSGRKILQEATLAVKAVEDLGGASKLTESEQARLNRTLTEAVAKYKALGQEAPKSLTDMEAATRKAGGAVGDTTTKVSGLSAVIAKLGPMIAATFSIGAITAFARSMGEFAGKMVDLSAQTGISTDRLQALNYAAAGAGLTIDDITTSVDQLSRRLAGGDNSAAGAVTRLGVSLDDLVRMSPDKAFTELGSAIAKIENPMERTRTAMELFGKSGSRMLRLFTEDTEGMIAAIEKTGPIIDQELLEKADRFSDAWDQAWLKFKAAGFDAISAIGTLYNTVINPSSGLGKRAEAASQAAQEQAKRALKAATSRAFEASPERGRQSDLGSLFRGIPSDLDQIEARLNRSVETQQRWRAKVAETDKSYREMLDSVAKINSDDANARGLALMWQDVLTAQEQANVSIDAYLSSLKKIGDVGVRPPDLPSFPAAPSLPFQSLPWVDALQDIPELDGMGRIAGTGFLSGFGDLLKNQLGPTVMAAFTGGGDVLKSVGGLLGGELGKGIVSKFSLSFSSSALGKVLSSVLPGLGSLLGPGIGKLFGKLFGGEGKKVNDMRDQFIASAGGLDALNQKAVAAGTSLDKLLAAKKVKDFEAAVADLNATMGEFAAEQAADAERLTAAIQKYGFSFEELAPKMQQADLNSQAKELIEDWRVLTAAFESTVPVNAKMGESINAYLATALKVGAEIPAAMRPILQSMIDQGLLTDEAGNKITDLEASGIKFSETMTEGFDRVVEKLQELLDKLGSVSSGIGSLPREIDIGVRYREGPFQLPDPGYIDPSVYTDGAVPSFAHGTGGRYLDFGSGTPAMLHGRERIMTRAEGQQQPAIASSADTVAAVDRLGNRLDRLVLQLPQQIAASIALARGRGASYAT